MNNEEIIRSLNAIRDGDKRAFEELYMDMQTPIYTIIYRITWDKTISEDILQEVFLKLYLSPPGDSVRNPRAYIFQMARNQAVDNMRRQTQHISFDDIPEIQYHPPEDTLLRMDIDSALKNLPTQECQIVTLHIIGELKFREISELMEIPISTVIWKYRNAIGKLQKSLSGGI